MKAAALEDERPGRRIRGHLLALSGSVVLSLLLGEVTARIFFRDEVSNEAIAARLRPATGERSLVRPHPDPDIFYELIPNLRKRFLGTLVRTDSQGIRVGARSPRTSAPGGRPGVIVGIGDSSMFGWGVRQRDTYLHRLETLLNRSSFDRRFEVRNLAVPGYNSEQELAVFRKKALAMNPEALLLHYDHNDPDPIGAEYRPDYIAPETGDNPLRSALIKLVVRRITHARNRNRIHIQGEHKRLSSYIFAGPAYNRHLNALAEIGSIARERGIPVCVVVFDAWITHAPDRSKDPHYQTFHRALIPFLRDQGFAVVDLYDVFQAYMGRNGQGNTRTLWVGPRDGHPNPKGHALIAQAAYEAMRSDRRFQELLGAGEASAPPIPGRLQTDAHRAGDTPDGAP